MGEIGGYIEFEYYHGHMLHDDGIKLDCGRSCLGYLIRAKNIRRIAMPSFMCDSVFNVLHKYNVEPDYYKVGYDFKPVHPGVRDDTYLYISNYYGQITEDDIKEYKKSYPHIIVDNTQAYFSAPVPGVDTFYTCRKYFGVPDGGVLYTSALLQGEIERSESFDHMTYLLGRFERSASEFYSQSAYNNDRFEGQPVKRMSKLTENLLRGIDYEYVRKKREENYSFLHQAFQGINRLKPEMPPGPFAYPLFLDEAPSIREKLVREKIYIPVLWPNVVKTGNENPTDYDLAAKILPLPCDQRYGRQEMQLITDRVLSFL